MTEEQVLTRFRLPVVQDSIGAPPAIALAEKDGQVVGIKLWCDHDDIEEGTPFDAQPGKLVF